MLYGITIPIVASVSAPTLTSVSTNGGAVGDIAGGYTATLTGTNFTGATGVTFGGTAATGITVVSSTSITCTVPAHATGAVSVIVTTAGGSNGANTAFRYFSPAELGLTVWYRSPGVAPWSPTASAGNSGTCGNMIAGTSPTAGATLNSYSTASFNGTTQFLTDTNPNGAAWSNGGSGFIATLSKPSSAVAASAGYDDPTLFGDQSNTATIQFTASGYGILVQDGVGYKVVRAAASVSNWHCAIGRWNGTLAGILVDSGTEQTIAMGALAGGPSATIRVGENYAGAVFYAGLQEEVIVGNFYPTTQNLADIKSYFNTRYNLTL